MGTQTEAIKARSKEVLERIARAAEKCQRDPADITLIAVSKTWPLETLHAAYDAGLRHLGENRTNELNEKRPGLEALIGSDSDITWHFIGHLQTRQSQSVVNFADMFHAADRDKIITRLSKQTAEANRPLDLLLEVNISGEESKAGYQCSNWEDDMAQKAAMVKAAKAVADASHLNLRGLMTMAPWGADPDFIKSVFERTRNLRNWLNSELGQNFDVLSMGMTDDFELAIEAGATHVRVGRAIFGDRH